MYVQPIKDSYSVYSVLMGLLTYFHLYRRSQLISVNGLIADPAWCETSQNGK